MIRRFILVASILVTSDALAAPQAQAPTSGLPSPVRLLLTVTDKAGRPVSNLTASEFKVFEEGKPQTITGFNEATNLPLSILLAVDTSGSLRGAELNDVLNRSLQLLQTVLRRGTDRVALVTFSSSGKLEQEFTDDIGSLKAALNRGIVQRGGGTRLYDTLSNASAFLAVSNGRKVIIVISDGDDTDSQISREEAMRQVAQNDMTIFAIFATYAGRFPGFDEIRPGKQILERMAEDSGGLFFDSRDLKRFDNLRSALTSQYTVEFQSNLARTNGKYRKIRIEALNKDYRLLYRPGYYPGK